MKKLLITLTIAALSVPATFAQMPKTGTKPQAQHATASTGKAVTHAVTLQSLPEATRDAITKAVGSGKITRLVSVTTNGTVTYRATVTEGKKKSTMHFDSNGNVM